MRQFHISKLVVSGDGKDDAIIDFASGLTVISGPSNSGKSCILNCIDYCFGGGDRPLDESFGYERVRLELSSQEEKVSISRCFGSNQADVMSTVSYVESGTYFAGRGKSKRLQSLSSVWLSLIGIEEEPAVIKNKHFKTNTMSWRMLSPLFFLDEEKVDTKASALLPRESTAKTSLLSSLIYLIEGKALSGFDVNDSAEIKEAKVQAVKDYAHMSLTKIRERITQINSELDLWGDMDLVVEIDKLLDQIKSTEKELVNATNQSQELYAQTDELKQEQVNKEVLLSRYYALKTQLEADLRRLSFINQAEDISSSIKQPQTCPFCDALLKERDAEKHEESLRAEFKKTFQQHQGLLETIDSLKQEITYGKQEQAQFAQQIDALQNLIHAKLTPRFNQVKNQYHSLKQLLELKNEKSILENLVSMWNQDMYDWVDSSNQKEEEYHPRDILGSLFVDGMSTIASEILKETNFTNLDLVRFNMSSFDLDINGSKKETFQGKGYRSFINTVLLLTMRKYLYETACFSPGILLVDTPFLGLDEGETFEISDGMKVGMFKYFLEHQEEGQLIIIENTEHTPQLDYDSSVSKHIVFTKSTERGRYGFLPDVK